MTFATKFVSVKKDFDMNSASSCVFHHSQWESCKETEHVSLPYLLYRFLFMIILISSLTFSTLCQSHLFEIFLTNWSFTLQTLYGIIFCCNTVWTKREFLLHKFTRKIRHSYQESNGKSYELKETNCYDNVTDAIVDEESSCVSINCDVTPEEQQQQMNPVEVVIATTDTSNTTTEKQVEASVIRSNNNNNSRNYPSPTAFEKLIWILMNVVHVLPHVVVVGYWVFVYKYDPDQKSCERFRSHYIVHGATSLLALIDSIIVAVPARKTHFVFPSSILLIYCVFSYIYEISGGRYRNGKEYIYSILNWRYKPGRTILLVCGGVILSPLVHMITCWGFHHIKLKLVSYVKRERK